LNNQDLGISDNVDSISVKLDREAAGIVPFEFSSEAISTPENTTSNNEISGTPEDDNLFGTNAAEKINGGRGDDDIFGNGGMDTLVEEVTTISMEVPTAKELRVVEVTTTYLITVVQI